LFSGGVRSKCLASRSGCFPPRYPLDRRLRGSQAGFDAVEMRISRPYRDSNSDPTVVQPVAQSLYRLSYRGSRLLELINVIPHNHPIFITEDLESTVSTVFYQRVPEEKNSPNIWADKEFHGARVSVVVKALCYKPEGRGLETR
jgi:hypothetical protein